jgi:hypothetical protein
MANRAIEQQIRLALTQIFTNELVIPGDPLSLKTIRVWPLQDDPTLVAPYVCFGPHPQLGRVPDEEIQEIGGATYFWTVFRLIAGTPLGISREIAWDNIEDLSTRLENVIQEHYNLANVLAPGALIAASGLEAITIQDPITMMLGSASRIYGGDNQFYGETKMIWRYRIQRVRTWS